MKCKFIDGKKVCTGKSYKPWKMWGSWIGAVLGLIMAIVASQITQQNEWIYNILVPSRMLFNFANLGGTIGGALFTVITWTVINIILGFCAGWVLTILYRRFVK